MKYVLFLFAPLLLVALFAPGGAATSLLSQSQGTNPPAKAGCYFRRWLFLVC